ncbi:hypothetical protein, partial [Phocaeicola vulgatus]|uniref:hypothetical protein n=1 Tax=Phocaeicola vulgatus TaxID=821 RepID=UPI00356ABA1B
RLAFSSDPCSSQCRVSFLSGKDEDYKTYHTVCTALGPAPFLRIGAPSGTRAHFAARGEGGDNGYGLQGAGTDSMDRRQG